MVTRDARIMEDENPPAIIQLPPPPGTICDGLGLEAFIPGLTWTNLL